MNYLQYYGLSQEPFSNAPVSKFYFNSSQHAKALLRLQAVAEGMKGLGVLVGDIGAGKTTLARRMLDQLPEDEYEAALLVIIHSGITAEWLLKRIASQLGVKTPADDKLTVLSQLYERLVEINKKGKKAIVLIDEAQMLQTRDIMEEFRGLLNLEIPGSKLITFIFFGLPELDQNLKLDEPLAGRIAMRYHLEPLNEEATTAYIDHRLRLSGCTKPLLLPDAIRVVHQYSHGIPRIINTICDNALFEGSLTKQEQIGASLIRQIASDLGLDQTGQSPAAHAVPKPAGAPGLKAPPATPRLNVPPSRPPASQPAAASHAAAPHKPTAKDEVTSLIGGAADDEIDDILGKIGT
ncbi:MAG: AAA family ATPase [Deltaproteobacteria bacterium]|nr:AAA family ATPase [Deltaproteobacteria bacterium]